MNPPETCGQGLAERSAIPAKLGALVAAMAENLETHQRSLDLTDENAKAEREAYEVVASAFRSTASELRATADRMVGYRALPMARHDEAALSSPEVRDAFARLIEREEDLSALLETLIHQDRAMLGGDAAADASTSASASSGTGRCTTSRSR